MVRLTEMDGIQIMVIINLILFCLNYRSWRKYIRRK